MAANIIGELIWKITGDNSSLNRSLKTSEQQVKKSSGGMTKAFATFGKFLTGGAVVGGLLAIGKAAISGAAKLQQQTVAFETLLGSAERATSLIDELRKLAAFTPFSQEGLIENAKLLLNFGIEGDKVVDIMSMIGDVAAGDEQKLNSLSLAFAQIQSTGRLTGQDLLQMVNAGFNPLQIISEKTGKSMAVLKDEMSKGAISADAVTEAFEDATSEGGRFYQMSVKQSKTLSGQWSTLKDNANLLATDLGTNLVPALTSVLESINEILDTSDIKKQTDALDEIVRLEEERGKALIELKKHENDLIGAGGIAKNQAQDMVRLIDRRLKQQRELATNAASELEAWRQRGLIAQEVLKSEKTPKGPSKDAIKRWIALKKEAKTYTDSILEDFNKRVLSEETLINISHDKRLKELEKYLRQGLISEEEYTRLVVLLNKNKDDEINKSEARLFSERQSRNNSYVQAIGNSFNTLLSGFQSYFDSIADAQIANLDAQLQRELEAAGVSEETTVEQAQREYDIAVESGSELEKEEKRRALVKAQIEEKYQKKKAKIEYEAALASWEIQRAMAVIGVPLAVMNALVSGWAAAAINPALAVWYPALLAGLAGASGVLQIAAVDAAKPTAPKFAEGGIVPGTSYTGDKVTAQVNSGEAFLTQAQQARFMEIANGADVGRSGNITIYFGEELIYDSMYKASQRGDLIIDTRAVVSR